ncbi:MAG: hypothetical protein IJR58_03265, partial [Lachnospiraceae bacterium]|nr:hypothetical protein [Lachnospiraceae bacterium]
GLFVYLCKECAGEIIASETDASTKCPFCGNNVVMKEQFAGDLKPDFVLPFATTINDAKAAYRNHIKSKKLVPKLFFEESHIDEIRGVYVPFWLFDATVDARLLCKCTKTKNWSDNQFQYQETSDFDVSRRAQLSFEGVPVDGSKEMADDLMESLEPFDRSKKKPFNTGYLAGFLANRYDVNMEESAARAKERIAQSAAQAMQSTVSGYATVQIKDARYDMKKFAHSYALYPVWLLNTTWKGTRYLFAMNGQSGNFIGDLPTDNGAATRYFFAIAAVLFVIGLGISMLL